MWQKVGSLNLLNYILKEDDILKLYNSAKSLGRGYKGERDGLLIIFMFETFLKVGECLNFKIEDLWYSENGCGVSVPKSNRSFSRFVKISTSLYDSLNYYANKNNISASQKIFSITTTRAWNILERCFQNVNFSIPKGVGYCNFLRHSGAMSFFNSSRDSSQLQIRLGHKSPAMTIQYIKAFNSSQGILDENDFDSNSSVYLMISHQSGLIKIGRSFNPKRRLKDLRSTDSTIELVGAWPSEDALLTESLLHKLYKDNRVFGEWFDLSEYQQRELKIMLNKG